MIWRGGCGCVAINAYCGAKHPPLPPHGLTLAVIQMAKVLYRFLEVESATEGNLKLAFSSEHPVLRTGDGTDHKRGEKYWEVLDHNPENADIKLLQNRGAFIDEHVFKDQLGVIEKAEICADKVGRAEVSFCSDSHSKNREVQLRAKQRPHISFGYIHTRLISETVGEDKIPVKRLAWQAYEISSVAAPADPTVGVGRTLTRDEENRIADLLQKFADLEEKKLRAVDSVKLAEAEKTAPNNLQTKIMAEPIIAPTEAELTTKLEPALRSKIEGEIHTRNSKTLETITAGKNEIRAIADEHCKASGANWAGNPGEVFVVADKIRSFQIAAFEALDKGTSASEVRNTFKTDCGELVRSSHKPENPAEVANLPEEIASRCSMKRLWDEADKAFERGLRSAAFKLTDGAEAESEKEIRLRSQRFPGGMGVEPIGQLFPANIRCSTMTLDAKRAMKRALGGRMTRDALSTDYPTMGAGIAPEYMTPIELLRNKMVFGRLGVTMISGVVGSPIVLPRQTAPGTADSLPEGTQESASDINWDQVRLTPHRISSVRKYSRFGMTQFPGFEAYAWDDGMQTIAIKADYLGLNGGANGDEPTGILNQFGIGQVAFGGSAANAYKNLIALETSIRKSNIDEEPVFVTTSMARGTLRITPATLTGSTVVSGQSSALWDGEELIGRSAQDSQQVPNDIVVCFVPRHVLFADWLGTAVVLDTLTLADTDKYKLTLNKYIDWGLRHPSAVARSLDSLAVLS